jgi:oligopeptide transport system permease protein
MRGAAAVAVFVARRVALSIPLLLAVMTLAFFIIRLTPGGPFDTARALPPEIEASLRRAYHLDDPLWRQYLRYLGGFLKGDLGVSLFYRDEAVGDLIGRTFPVSLIVGGLSVVAGFLAGTLAGLAAAARPEGWIDRSVTIAGTLLVSVPTFVIGPLLALVFGLWLDLTPIAGWRGGEPVNLILPVVTLALPTAAYVARLMRGGLIEAMNSDFARSAKARGAPPATVLIRHALPPALLPVVSFMGPAAAAVLAGSVVVEGVFALPGMGVLFANAALNRDYPVISAVVVLYAALMIGANLAADLCYGLLDPRLSVGR